MIYPILKSPMFAFNLNSLHFILFLRTWFTIFTPSSQGLHFSNIFCNICKEFLSFNNFTQEHKIFLQLLTSSQDFSFLVWSNNGVMSYNGTSSTGFVHEVDTIFSSRLSCLASLNVSFSLRESNLWLGVVCFLTHWYWSQYFFVAYSPILAPPIINMLIFFPYSYLFSTVILWTFWFFWFLLSCTFINSVEQSFVSWFVARKYIHVIGGCE